MKKGKVKQRMKRFSALFLSLMLICAMSMTAFATDGTENTTVADGAGSTTDADGSGSSQTADLSGHSFTAYQIFSGTYSEELGKLSNIDWGKDANDEVKKVIAETLKVDVDLAAILTAFEGVKTESKVANDLAAAIASKLDMKNGGTPVDGSTENLEHGYYIVIDTSQEIGEGESRNLALLQCTDGTIKITPKTGTVTSDKKVKDMNDSDAYDPSNGVLNTSADYDIGDDVEFVLTGEVAENYDMYTTYRFVFHDTMSAGLTFNEDSVIVKINGTQITTGYEVVTASNENLENGETFGVVFQNLKDITEVTVKAGDKIEISYTATLTGEAVVIGAEGNENKMYLEYSNNPSGEGTGKTPEKTVVVFTYKVEVNKVDGEENALEGAGFALYKVDNNYNGNDGVKNADGSMQNELNDKKYNKLVARYENTDGKMTTFSFEGIDDGEYLLVETKTPEGYNSIEPIAFTVTAGHVEGKNGIELISLEGKAAGGQAFGMPDSDSGTVGTIGTLTTDVVNKSGSLLPSTGGIGTTMFYIIGGVLMVGACMMLFVRKIMTNEKR